jgi:hypothetical protein
VIIVAQGTGSNAVPQWMTPSHLPGQGDLLTWCQTMGPATAMVLILAGVVYLIYGRGLYQWLVTLNAAVVGAYFGSRLGGGDASMVGAMLGGVLAGAVAWPYTKYSVAATGGAFGVAVGATMWRLFDGDPHYAWAGGMTGMVFFGMLSFILFDMSVLVFMCGQGAAMLVFGLLGMAYKYPDMARQIGGLLGGRPMLLPVVIAGAAGAGWWWQRKSGGAAPAAGGGGGGGGGGKGGKDAR